MSGVVSMSLLLTASPLSVSSSAGEDIPVSETISDEADILTTEDACAEIPPETAENTETVKETEAFIIQEITSADPVQELPAADVFLADPAGFFPEKDTSVSEAGTNADAEAGINEAENISEAAFYELPWESGSAASDPETAQAQTELMADTGSGAADILGQTEKYTENDDHDSSAEIRIENSPGAAKASYPLNEQKHQKELACQREQKHQENPDPQKEPRHLKKSGYQVKQKHQEKRKTPKKLRHQKFLRYQDYRNPQKKRDLQRKP